MAEKVPTTMVLRVDLQCHRCFKNVQNVLCKFPEIRDEQYNEKENTVTINMVNCCPEKFKQKILCKGGKTIKSIEIKPPSKPTDSKPPKKTETPNPPQQPTNPPPKPQPPKDPNPRPPQAPKGPNPRPPQPPNDPNPRPPQPPPVLGFPPVFSIDVCIKSSYLCPPGSNFSQENTSGCSMM